MATPPDLTRSGSVRRLLQESSPQVHYDASAGLARHEQLVAEASPLPEWASELEASASPRGLSTLAKRAWWLGGALMVAGVLWLGSNQLRRADPPTHELAAGVPVASAAQATALVVASRGLTSLDDGRPADPSASLEVAGERAASARAAAARPAIAGATDVHEDAPLAPALSPRGGLPSGALEHPQKPGVVGAAPLASAPMLGTRPLTKEPRAAQQNTSASSSERSKAGPKTRSRVAAEAPQDAEEMRQLAEAERLLGPEPVRALRIVRAGQLSFRGGYFTQERRYIEVMALFALGRHGEAHAHAAWFLRDYPNGPYRHRVETEMLRFPVR